MLVRTKKSSRRWTNLVPLFRQPPEHEWHEVVEQRSDDGREVAVRTLVDQRLDEGAHDGAEAVVGNVRETLKGKTRAQV